MEKKFRLENLGCANCAAKMESEIKKLAGVEEVSVNFMTQKLTIKADEADIGSIIAKAEKIVKKIEPDCLLIVK